VKSLWSQCGPYRGRRRPNAATCATPAPTPSSAMRPARRSSAPASTRRDRRSRGRHRDARGRAGHERRPHRRLPRRAARQVPGVTINRFCSSRACRRSPRAQPASLAGWHDVVLAGGVESMSQIPMGGQKPSPNPDLMAPHPEVYTPMGITAENVASRFGVTRADQDAFALESHRRAVAAIQAGRFKSTRSCPCPPASSTARAGRTSWWTRTRVRAPTRRSRRSASSGGVQGRRQRHGGQQLPGERRRRRHRDHGPRGRRSQGPADPRHARSYQVVGVPPEIMGVGPRYAIPKALEKAGLTIVDIGTCSRSTRPSRARRSTACASSASTRAKVNVERRRHRARPPARLHRRQAHRHPAARAARRRPATAWCRCASAAAWARPRCSRTPPRAESTGAPAPTWRARPTLTPGSGGLRRFGAARRALQCSGTLSMELHPY
jgi:hypothetical protein